MQYCLNIFKKYFVTFLLIIFFKFAIFNVKYSQIIDNTNGIETNVKRPCIKNGFTNRHIINNIYLL